MRHAVRHLKKSDSVLAAIIEQVGPFRLQYREPTFEAMLRSIVFQQLAGKAARAIWGRLEAACTSPGTPGVSPAAILKLREEQMRVCGLSRQKMSYIRDLASRTESGEVDFERLPAMSEDEVIEHLTRVKGIGTWSAHMFLIFALRRPDIMPTGDYGVRSAIKKHYRKRKLPNPEQMLKISAPWRPYRSVASWYLWQSLDIET